MKTWRMRIACWIPKAKNTQSGCVILSAFSTATIIAGTRLNVTLQTQHLSCLFDTAVLACVVSECPHILKVFVPPE